METGYVFLHLKPGKKKYFLTKIREVEGVTDVQLVIGLFDAIVRIERQSIEDLERLYFSSIDRILGVADSRLQIVACPRSMK